MHPFFFPRCTRLSSLLSLLTPLLAKAGAYYGLFSNHGCIRTRSLPRGNFNSLRCAPESPSSSRWFDNPSTGADTAPAGDSATEQPVPGYRCPAADAFFFLFFGIQMTCLGADQAQICSINATSALAEAEYSTGLFTPQFDSAPKLCLTKHLSSSIY